MILIGAIYRVWNTANGKSYIGRSNRPYHRILQHLMPNSQDGSPEIYDDLLNYPPSVWEWEILYDETNQMWLFPPPLTDINTLEREYINQFDSQVHGYNIRPGGEGFPSGPTQDETTLRSGMRDMVIRAITDYQTQHQEQLDIIEEYGSLSAYREHQQEQLEIEREAFREEQARRDNIGCIVAISIFAFLFFSALISRGC